MAKDYAQRGGSRRSQTQQKGGLPAWVWMVFGLSIGLAVAAFVYISRPHGALPGQSEAPPAKAEREPARKKTERIPLPPEEKDRFSFYKDLKKQSAYIPRDERPAIKRPPEPASGEEQLYLIQVASFRTNADAENQKANLALLGIEARIEKVTVDDKDTYFRVRVGPADAERTQTLLGRLQDNGLNGLVVKAN